MISASISEKNRRLINRKNIFQEDSIRIGISEIECNIEKTQSVERRKSFLREI